MLVSVSKPILYSVRKGSMHYYPFILVSKHTNVSSQSCLNKNCMSGFGLTHLHLMLAASFRPYCASQDNDIL